MTIIFKALLVLVALIVPPIGFVFSDSGNKKSFLVFALWIFVIFLFFKVSFAVSIVFLLLLWIYSVKTILKFEHKIGIIMKVPIKLWFLVLTSIVAIVSGLMFNRVVQFKEEGSLKSQPVSTKASRQAIQQCLACHRLSNENFVGPSLRGVYGRKAGSVENYVYTDAMKTSQVVWNETTLTKFLENQNDVVIGTKMIISPLPKSDIVLIVDYLKSQK